MWVSDWESEFKKTLRYLRILTFFKGDQSCKVIFFSWIGWYTHAKSVRVFEELGGDFSTRVPEARNILAYSLVVSPATEVFETAEGVCLLFRSMSCLVIETLLLRIECGTHDRFATWCFEWLIFAAFFSCSSSFKTTLWQRKKNDSRRTKQNVWIG